MISLRERHKGCELFTCPHPYSGKCVSQPKRNLLFSTTDNATLKFNVYIDGPKIAEKMDKVIEVKSLKSMLFFV
jgi:hypothetical protein